MAVLPTVTTILLVLGWRENGGSDNSYYNTVSTRVEGKWRFAGCYCSTISTVIDGFDAFHPVVCDNIV
jgi:hypothetical protein